jgi:two-component system sensor kinase FixL
MAANIAHEINNPLTIIMGKASTIQRMIDNGNYTPEQLKEQLVKIETTAIRISTIIKGLRTFERFDLKGATQFTGRVPGDLNEGCHPI